MRRNASGVPAGRRRWWIFAPLVAAPALILALLGLRALRVERIEREQQARERQAQFARLADAAIARRLDHLADLARTPDSRASGMESEAEDSIFAPLIYAENGLLSFPRDRIFIGRLGQRPALAPSLSQSATTLARIERARAAEAQYRTQHSIALLEEIRTAAPNLRPWANFGIQRIRHRASRTPLSAKSLPDGWTDPAALSPDGLPVAVMACAYAGRFPADQRREFASLFRQTLIAMRGGSWWLSLEQRRFYDAELVHIIRSLGPPDVAERDPRLNEIAAVDAVVRSSPPARRDSVTRSYGRTGGAAFLIIWSPSNLDSGVWTGAAVQESGLHSLLSRTLKALLAGQSTSASLRDAGGATLWNEAASGTGAGLVERLDAVPEWQLVFPGPETAPGTDQRQLLWYGVIFLSLIMLAFGLVMTGRMVHHEMRISRLQSDFIASVTHEFKSPITSVRLLVERIAGGRVHTRTAMEEYCAAIGCEMDRLERLVNRLLDLQLIEMGGKQYRFETGSLADACQIAADRLRTRAEAKAIAVAVHSSGNIPALQLDKIAIADAIENLVDNAVKYSPAGSRVEVAVRADGPSLLVEVADSGCGIDPEDLPRIFDKFYRGRRGNDLDVQGSGLGLALARATSEAHKGSITVRTVPGKGSSFTIRLPAGGRSSDDGKDSHR